MFRRLKCCQSESASQLRDQVLGEDFECRPGDFNALSGPTRSCARWGCFLSLAISSRSRLS
eukprot:3683020-Pyramimonas_sp.AAC.1